MKGLLEAAWKENIERYTRHKDEFDQIIAAAVQYRRENGTHPKSRTVTHDAKKLITRLAPPSSDVEMPSDVQSSPDEEDEDD